MTVSPWLWLTAGVVLAALEMVASGVYLLWIGLGAIGAGIALWLVPSLGLEAQLVVFAVASVAWAFVGQLVYRRMGAATDRPMLNRRGEQLVGREAVLETAISRGEGHIRLDDTTWRVRGPDLPAGTAVRIVAADSATLRVKPLT